MLTPMQVQYLVGLCCVRRNPEAVDVIVGDMVLDEAAGKHRDVDVTVTVRGDDGSLTGFKAYEAKREGMPLDTVAVEQLVAKLTDMPSLTERGIVSTSGYSQAAERKAAAHGVRLYTLKPWARPVSEQFPAFPGVGLPQEFLSDFQSVLLYWINWKFQLVVPDGPSSFNVAPDAKVFAHGGGQHKMFPTWDKYS
jgi:hypothetical protein